MEANADMMESKTDTMVEPHVMEARAADRHRYRNMTTHLGGAMEAKPHHRYRTEPTEDIPQYRRGLMLDSPHHR